jgi:membrane protein required for colicin V production
MTWVDGVILAVLAVSAVLAWARGFVHEVLGVGAWIGAVVATLAARPVASAYAAQYVEQPWLADALGSGAVFLVVLVVLKLVSAWLAGHVQRSALGGVDKALGLVFGLGRGAFLVVLAYIIAGIFVPATERWPPAVLEARALPVVVDGAQWVVERLPPDFRPKLVEPPERPDPTVDDLLRPPARSRS